MTASGAGVGGGGGVTDCERPERHSVTGKKLLVSALGRTAYLDHSTVTIIIIK